jgi:hypothetical protein
LWLGVYFTQRSSASAWAAPPSGCLSFALGMTPNLMILGTIQLALAAASLELHRSWR